MFLRMKAAMAEEIEARAGTMFLEATKAVDSDLDNLLGALQDILKEGLLKICDEMARDYNSLLSRSSIDASKVTVRRIKEIIHSADAEFTEIWDQMPKPKALSDVRSTARSPRPESVRGEVILTGCTEASGVELHQGAEIGVPKEANGDTVMAETEPSKLEPLTLVTATQEPEGRVAVGTVSEEGSGSLEMAGVDQSPEEGSGDVEMAGVTAIPEPLEKEG